MMSRAGLRCRLSRVWSFAVSCARWRISSSYLVVRAVRSAHAGHNFRGIAGHSKQRYRVAHRRRGVLPSNQSFKRTALPPLNSSVSYTGKAMSQQRHCPYCERSITIGYLELCTLPMWPTFRRWRGRCYHCNCDLQASAPWELLTGLISTFAVVAAFVLLVPVHPRPSNSLVWIYAILSLLVLYLFNGLVRYLTISYPELS